MVQEDPKTEAALWVGSGQLRIDSLPCAKDKLVRCNKAVTKLPRRPCMGSKTARVFMDLRGTRHCLSRQGHCQLSKIIRQSRGVPLVCSVYRNSGGKACAKRSQNLAKDAHRLSPLSKDMLGCLVALTARIGSLGTKSEPELDDPSAPKAQSRSPFISLPSGWARQSK